MRDDLAVVDDDDVVGEGVGLFEVLRGEQHGGAAVDDGAHDVPHVLALGGVEAGGGFVEEHDLGVAREGGGEVEAPAHAARVGLGHAVGGVGEVEPLEQFRGARLGIGSCAC